MARLTFRTYQAVVSWRRMQPNFHLHLRWLSYRVIAFILGVVSYALPCEIRLWGPVPVRSSSQSIEAGTRWMAGKGRASEARAWRATDLWVILPSSATDYVPVTAIHHLLFTVWRKPSKRSLVKKLDALSWDLTLQQANPQFAAGVSDYWAAWSVWADAFRFCLLKKSTFQ